MSQLQSCSVMCSKNESYCENEKRESLGGVRLGGGCQDGCEWRSEAFVKIQKFKLKKIYIFLEGGGGGGGRVGLGAGLGGGGGGGQVDVNGEVKLL